MKIKAAKDLDTIIAAHESFVDVVVSKILLDAKSSVSKVQIIDIICQFKTVLFFLIFAGIC